MVCSFLGLLLLCFAYHQQLRVLLDCCVQVSKCLALETVIRSRVPEV